MKCPQCGIELDAAARFCGSCGHRITPQSKAAAPARSDGQAGLAVGPSAPRAPVAPAPVRAGVAPVAAPVKASVKPAAVGTPPRAADGAALASTAPATPVTPMPVSKSAPVQVVAKPSVPASGSGARPAAPAAPAKAAAGSSKDPFVGQTLNNRYLVEAKLGQGGFGAVYKGKQTLAGREVALKVLHPDMARDQNLVARFRREGAVACNLRDAHTVTTYDFDQTPDGVLYIAMELLTGRSLHDIFYDEAPLPWRRVVRVLEQMCSSLGEAHRQGIVHRDIKPENVYLEDRPGQQDYVKVLDFGIAKIIRGDLGGSASAPQLTATGQTLGTLEYMSPEQLMGKQLDGRSDIYAMGVLGYELLTGHLPFPDANGPAELIAAQLKKTPPGPGTANPGGEIPPAVDGIILRMLEKDRARRYQDVDELAADIVGLLSSNGRATGPAAALSSGLTPAPAPLPAPPASVPSPGASLAGSQAQRPYTLAPKTSESEAAPGSRSRAVLWALIAVVVLLGALAGVYFGVVRPGAAAPSAAPEPAAPGR
jgi:serine/threonine-protein kinase